MAITPGVFTADAFNKAKVKMASIFGENNNAHRHLHLPSPVFDCIAHNQNIKLNGPATILTDGRRCEGIDVSWLNVCDLTMLENCAPSGGCSLDGKQLGADSKSYINNLTFCNAYKIKESQCTSVHELEEKRALAITTLLASLDQELERRSIGFLEANADDLTGLTLPAGAVDPVDDTLWNILASDFKAELFIEFEKLLTLLNIPNGRVIDGNNFYSLIKLAKAKMAEGNCCTADKLYDLLPICQDIRNIDQITSDKRTFLVDSSNIGYFNTVINKNTSPMRKDDPNNTSVWSMPSRRLRWREGNTLRPVMYDIKYQYKCDSTGNGHDYIGVFHGEHRGAFILGPDSCNGLNGIIKIANVASLPPVGDGDGDGDGDGEA